MTDQAQNQARVIPLRPQPARPQPAHPRPGHPQTPRPRTGRAEPALPASVRPAGHGVPAASREPLWRDLVGGVLRRERRAQERTLQDVADAARISMPYLSEIERGRKEASSEVLAAAAQALGLGLGDLLSLAQGELTRVTGRNAGRGRSTSATRYDGLCLAA